MGNAVAVTAQIWVTFVLSILKDVIIQFVINNNKFRKAFLWSKRRYLLTVLPYWKFLKKYKEFIKEKNEIFALMMSPYKDKIPEDPIFFFSALTQYWLLKKFLIQQYEKILNIYLVDDSYEIFEDEIKQARSEKTKNSLKKLIWKMKMTDREFKKEFDKSVENLEFLKSLISGKKHEEDDYKLNDSIDIESLSEEKAEKIIRDYISDERKLISQWKENKIKNIEKLDLYTETKLVQKYVKLLEVEVNYKDSVNLLRITNILNNSLYKIAEKTEDPSIIRKLQRSSKSYSKEYYKALIKKYLLVESKSPLKELSNLEAASIILKSSDYLQEKEELIEASKSPIISESKKWKIAYRLWELNEIRKNICITYLGIEKDFSKWNSSYEKVVSLASKSDTPPDNTKYDNAALFLKTNINPSEVFSI